MNRVQNEQLLFANKEQRATSNEQQKKSFYEKNRHTFRTGKYFSVGVH